ncbi:hypothetical protein [Streptomyces sp. NPDC058757]|uniref:hypothetical protein n=1 Tax=Streptomyces sp. NPDC058757 TaxID=3346626 RepID=UPI00369C0C06
MFTFGAGSGDTETQYMDKARIDAHFARMAADGVDVARVWMFSHESRHGFEEHEGEFNEQQYAAFDCIIESAKAHGLRLMPVFENYWEAYGGIDTRLRWEGLSGGHPARAAFFDENRCPGCFTSYKNPVSYALDRTHHYSGVKYKDEPAIFAWELMNEPRYEGQGAPELAVSRAHSDRMAAKSGLPAPRRPRPRPPCPPRNRPGPPLRPPPRRRRRLRPAAPSPARSPTGAPPSTPA